MSIFEPRQHIAGIGTDITYISRIQATYERFGWRFAQRILGPQEQEVFERRLTRHEARGLRYLATRFAAKEAFSKAIGLGMRMPMAWSRMQTLNARSGKPEVVLATELQQWYQQRFGSDHISMYDGYEFVIAFVIVYV